MPILTLTMNPALDLHTVTRELVPSRKLRCSEPRFDPGGGGINVARVLARLGGDPLAVWPGGGPAGARIRDLLAAEDVRNECVPIPADTRQNVTVKEGASGREFRFVLPGPRLGERDCRACLDALERHAAGARWLVASGSMPEGAGDAFLAELVALCRRRGLRLAVDTSGGALAALLRHGVDLVKPSAGELRELAGEPLPGMDDLLRAARALVTGGRAAMVALSMGPDGALLVTRDAALHAPALQVAVAGTIGAGDSFLAGLLLALERGAGGEEALAQAVAAASAALLVEGTSLCRPEDVTRLRADVSVRRL